MSTPGGGRPTAAAALVLTAAVSTQLGSALATRLFLVVGPPGAAVLRLWGAAVVLAVAAGPRALRGVPRAAVRGVVVLGLASGAMNLCFYEAISRIPLGSAVTLEFLGPITVAAATGRRPRQLAFVALALVGVTLVSGGPGGAWGFGAVMALAAGSMWGVYLVASRRVGADVPGVAGLSLAMLVGAAAFSPVLLFSHPGYGDLPIALALGLAVGAISNALAFAAEMAALRRTSLSTVGVLLALEPAIAALVGFVALHQSMSPPRLLGIGCVVVAGAGVVWWSDHPGRPAPPSADLGRR